MIKQLFHSQVLKNSLQNTIPVYQFSRMVTSTQKREYKKNQGKFILTPYVKDDLYYKAITETPNPYVKQGIDKLASDYLRNPDTNIDKKGICMLMYNLGKQGKYEEQYKQVFKNLEKHLYKFKEQFTPRLVYGALYGSYKTNGASNYCIQYFEEEFYRVKKDIVGLELVNLVEALSYNNVKTDKSKHTFLKQHLIQGLVQKFDEYKFNSSAVQNLLFSFERISYYDKEICEKVLAQIIANKSTKNIHKIVSVYETILKIENSGKFYRSLSEEIEQLKTRLQKRGDYEWLYNTEHTRFNTYQEIQAKTAKFEQKDMDAQQQGHWLHRNSSMLQSYFENKKNIKKVEEEIENKAKKSELDSLMYEKFMLENMGEENKAAEESEGDFDGKIEKEGNYHKLNAENEFDDMDTSEIDKQTEEEFKNQQKEIAEQQQQKKQSKKSNK